MKDKTKSLALFLTALCLGIIITLIDSSPSWDDTGVTAAMIFIVTAFLGFISPKRPWIWALVVGVWIPLYGIIMTHNYGSILALIISFVGAYTGCVIAKLFAMEK